MIPKVNRCSKGWLLSSMKGINGHQPGYQGVEVVEGHDQVVSEKREMFISM